MSNRRSQYLIVRALMAMGMVLAFGGIQTGCASSRAAPGGIREIDVALTSDQRVDVGGKVVTANRLPAALKSGGAGEDTVVKILFQPNQSKESFTQIVTILRQAGYPRVFFVSPKQVRTSANDGAKPSPPSR